MLFSSRLSSHLNMSLRSCHDKMNVLIILVGRGLLYFQRVDAVLSHRDDTIGDIVRLDFEVEGNADYRS